MARLKTQRATSAGGIVVRIRDGRPQLVVGMRRRERGVTWTLPKGTPRPGESLEETAVREVGEETGLVVAIRRPIGSIRYSFLAEDVRIAKTVHYFLMEAVGGHLARHDREFARVRWIDLDAAPALLTFETERELVARVGRLLDAEARTGAVPSGESAGEAGQEGEGRRAAPAGGSVDDRLPRSVRRSTSGAGRRRPAAGGELAGQEASLR